MDFSDLKDIIIKEALRARGSSLARRKDKDLSRPAASWTAPARIGSDKGTGLSIVFSTRGCSHAQDGSAGCTMCSYLLDGTNKTPSTEQLVQQFKSAYTKLDAMNAPLTVKLYTSGSFLDPMEVSSAARNGVLKQLTQNERVKEVVIESRAEYITKDIVERLKSILGDCRIEIGLGIESSRDIIRELCINKGTSTQELKRAIIVCRTSNVGVRAYVLLKPPFLSEQEAFVDSLETIREVVNWGATTVSINPVNVQKHTLVERLWERGQYRPPWLWTVIELLTTTRGEIDGSVNLVCDPVAAGKRRGAHNCKQCDDSVVRRIRDFSLTQDDQVFEGLSCDCKQVWKHVLNHEDVSLLVHTDDMAKP